MSTKEYLEAVEEIKDFICDKYENVIPLELEVIQVWYCKTIQNHKGLFIIRNISNEMIYPYFFECTYNGDLKQLYIDCYVKEFKHTLQY